MIQSLLIKSFGKFQNFEIPLKKINFIFGKNEAGKTTIFDAFVQAITSPKKSSVEGRFLKDRYGDSFQVEIKPSIPDSRDPSEFLNLHTLKAGEIRIDFENGNWTENLKKKLFAGGIDPSRVITNLESKSSTNGNLAHRKEWNKTQTQLISAKDLLSSLEEEKKNLLNQESNLLDLEAQAKTTKSKIQTLEQKKMELEKSLRLSEQIRERRRYLELFRKLENWKELTKKFQEFPNLDEKTEQDLSGLDTRILKYRGELESGKRSLLQEEESYNKEKLRFEKEGFGIAEASGPVKRLVILQDRIQESLRTGRSVQSKTWNKGYLRGGGLALVLAILLFLGKILGGFPESSELPWFALSGVFALVGLLFLYFARTSVTQEDLDFFWEKYRTYSSEFLSWLDEVNASSYADRWNLNSLWQREKNTDQNKKEKSEARFFLQDLRDQILRIIETPKQWESNLALFKTNLESKMGELERIKKEIHELESKCADLEKNRSKTWESLGVSSTEEFRKKKSERELIFSQIQTLEPDLQRSIGSEDWNLWESDARRKLQSWDEEGVPDRMIQDAEIQALRSDLIACSSELQDLQKKDQETELIATRKKVGLESQLNPLSQKILRTQTEILNLEDKLDQLESDRLAAEIAGNLVRKIQSEMDDSMAALSDEITSASAVLFGSTRTVRMDNLGKSKGKDQSIRVQDKSGEMRNIGHLSLGTRDALYIATKLALCEKNDPDLKFFLMDEPFLSLDEERLDKALVVLENYIKDKDWQILILSKEENLMNKFESRFGKDLNLIRLD